MNSTRSLPSVFLAFLFLHPLGVPFNAQAKGNSAYDRVCLHWEVEGGIKVNRQRSERLYKAACHWVKENIKPKGEPVKPCVVIKVGAPCPDSKFKACVVLSEGAIYLAEWDKSGPGYVVHGVLMLAFFEKIKEWLATEVTQELINKDFQQYLDVR